MTKAETIRLDKWLWYARFFKTRTLAAKLVSGGHVRINGVRAGKPAHAVGAGDVLTFAQGDAIRVVEIAACGVRRGPAPEAQALYIDTSPPPPPKAPTGPRFDSGGRPTKKDRRDMERMSETARFRPLE
ncbi:RNA-binding S4 domain-containing protein [Oceaniglobus ichthyenteri]|uniref:RNA-binding S4 domain-containing protein n=1 Tax=Oceaniglobus ichthyenteri TaxID=2136177 RepID=UPI000D35BFAE|nr:RNA-binding S4 domain-containing protein [Oceaniglobus ichthyenteri]